MAEFQRTPHHGELVPKMIWDLGQGTLEAWVIMSQAWGWEAPLYIELVAMLSVWDPYHCWGKGEDRVSAKAA